MATVILAIAEIIDSSLSDNRCGKDLSVSSMQRDGLARCDTSHNTPWSLTQIVSQRYAWKN